MDENIKLLLGYLQKIKLNIEYVAYAYESSSPLAMAYQIAYPRLEFVLEGQLSMSVGNRHNNVENITVSKNNALFIPKNGWNRPEWNQKVTTLSVIFANNIVGFSKSEWDGETFSKVEKINIHLKNTRICDLMLNLLNEFTFDTHYPKANTSILRTLLDFIIESITVISKDQNKVSIFDSIRHYIENNYHQNISRESVADQFHISPNHLSFIFKSQGHIKFIDFVNNVRLEHAKYLLQSYDLTIGQISELCGFRDANYFSRAFKKNNKCTPKQYRSLYGKK